MGINCTDGHEDGGHRYGYVLSGQTQYIYNKLGCTFTMGEFYALSVKLLLKIQKKTHNLGKKGILKI